MASWLHGFMASWNGRNALSLPYRRQLRVESAQSGASVTLGGAWSVAFERSARRLQLALSGAIEAAFELTIEVCYRS